MAHSDYQDTVAKMARKYSQYRLPNMTELVESDEDDNLNIDGPSNTYNNTQANANINNNEPGQHINDPYFSQQNISIMVQQQSLTNDTSMIIHSDAEDEDEDILSEAQTFISHKSFDNNSYIPSNNNNVGTPIPKHRLNRTLSKGSITSNKSKRVQFGGSVVNHTHFGFDNPIEEIREMQMDRQLFTDIFDKYFDEEKQDDVDFDEFKKGLVKLEVNMKEEQMQKLWNVLLSYGDNENDGYLDREQFGDFLTRRFEAPQLVAFQVCCIISISLCLHRGNF